jgi:hypothetical protein
MAAHDAGRVQVTVAGVDYTFIPAHDGDRASPWADVVVHSDAVRPARRGDVRWEGCTVALRLPRTRREIFAVLTLGRPVARRPAAVRASTGRTRYVHHVVRAVTNRNARGPD